MAKDKALIRYRKLKIELLVLLNRASKVSDMLDTWGTTYLDITTKIDYGKIQDDIFDIVDEVEKDEVEKY